MLHWIYDDTAFTGSFSSQKKAIDATPKCPCAAIKQLKHMEHMGATN